MNSSGQRIPWLYRFVRDRSGQSETIGVVLLLGLTVAGTTAIIGLGTGAIGGVEQSSELQRAEHVMTLLDSRGAMTALGESQTQQVDFGRAGGGSYGVDDDAGWIKIEHLNYTAAPPGDPQDNETLYFGELGAVVYTNEEETVAYQGGGVWRYRGGNSTMVSPPEFHYRDATLTLPVIRTTGSGSVAGSGTASITRTASVNRIYPNTTGPTAGDEIGAPYNATDESYVNPVRNGTVRVTVHSDYYQAWASYFDTRTEGDVSVDHANDLAIVDLSTVSGTLGGFQMPNHGGAVKVQAAQPGHPISTFNITLQDPGNSNGYKKMYWSLYAESGDEKFELQIYSADKQRCHPSPDRGPLTVSAYYENATASHEWVNSNVDPTSGDIRVECADLDGDGKDEPRIVADLAGSTTMTYKEITTSADKWHWDPSGTAASHARWNQHGNDVAYEVDPGRTFTKGSGTAELGEVTNHYVSLLGPDVDLRVAETSPSGKRVDEDASYGTLVYAQGGGNQYITFLHITENEIRVEVD